MRFRHVLVGLLSGCLLVGNASATDPKFQAMMEDPKISYEEKRQAYFDLLAKKNPQMAETLEIPGMKDIYENTFKQMYSSVQAMSVMKGGQDQSKSSEEDEELAKQRAYNKYAAKQQAKVKAEKKATRLLREEAKSREAAAMAEAQEKARQVNLQRQKAAEARRPDAEQASRVSTPPAKPADKVKPTAKYSNTPLSSLVQSLNNTASHKLAYEVKNIMLGESFESVKAKYPNVSIIGGTNLGTDSKQLRIFFYETEYTDNPIVSKIEIYQRLGGADASECKKRKDETYKKLVARYGSPLYANAFTHMFGEKGHKGMHAGYLNSPFQLLASAICNNGELRISLSADAKNYYQSLAGEIRKKQRLIKAQSKPVLEADF